MDWKWIVRKLIQVNLIVLIVSLLLFMLPKVTEPMINPSRFILTIFVGANIGGVIGLMIRILEK